MVLIAMLLGAGCGRVGFSVLGPPGDGGIDAAHDGSTDSGEDGATNFDAEPTDAGFDVGAPCAEMPCRLVIPQCGCPDGLACQRTMRGTPVRECVPPGGNLPGQPCDQSIQCVTGHTCFGLSGFPGICSRYCDSSAQCEGPGAACVIFTAPSEGVGACSHPCNPIEDLGCPESHGCHIVRTMSIEGIAVATTGCLDPAGPAPGEPCTALCAVGATCVGGTCVQVCVVEGAPICPGMGMCQPTMPPTVIGEIEYGTCAPGGGG